MLDAGSHAPTEAAVTEYRVGECLPMFYRPLPAFAIMPQYSDGGVLGKCWGPDGRGRVMFEDGSTRDVGAE